MTTAPAGPTATEPQGSPEPRPGHGKPFTTAHRILIGIVITLVVGIAGIGFAGSYAAVSHLAETKHFGPFARIFPIGLDCGIGAFLALDLLLTWLRIPFPLLRYGAWTLTAATIAFNADAAWPDPIGVGMHGVIPALFVIAVEAARHAVGRIADITADKHIDFPPFKRWIVAPWPTFRLWRRQIVWQVRSYEQAVVIERQRQVFRARLRSKYGRSWRRQATPEDLLALRLATRNGMTIDEALALPENEARAQEAAALERQRQAENEAAERARRDREEKEAAERAALARRQEEEDADRTRQIADAETAARLAEIQRQQNQADDDIARQRRESELAHARQLAEAEKQRLAAARQAADAADHILRAQKAAADEAQRKATAEHSARVEVERAAQVRTALSAANRSASASANPASGSSAGNPRTANHTAASPANAGTTAATSQRANRTASASDGLITTEQVVAAYQQLATELGKAPSDAALGERLGVSRSRAQQLRTAAIEAGHTNLAKPLRIA